MKTVLDEARGNVLFIDEAYTLYDGASDRKDFGARVIDSLLTVLSQPNPDMLVIFAGYLKEMDAMLNTNQGLTGRFPYKYQFADYNANQLYEIACSLLKRDAYILSPEADIQLRESVAKAYAQRDEHFSNARWVEQFVNNGIIPAMAGRISRTACDDYQTIEASDVCQAFIKFNPATRWASAPRRFSFPNNLHHEIIIEDNAQQWQNRFRLFLRKTLCDPFSGQDVGALRLLFLLFV